MGQAGSQLEGKLNEQGKLIGTSWITTWAKIPATG
jgi:hypothetical protein